MPRLTPPGELPAPAVDLEAALQRRELRQTGAIVIGVHLVILLAFFVAAKLHRKPQVEQIAWLDGGLLGGGEASAFSSDEPEPESEPEPEPEPLPAPAPDPEPEPPKPIPADAGELPLQKATPPPATHTPTPRPATPKPTPRPTPKSTPKSTPKPKPKPKATAKPSPKSTPKKKSTTPKPSATPKAAAKPSSPAPATESTKSAATSRTASTSASSAPSTVNGPARGEGTGKGAAGSGTGAGKPSDFGWYFSTLRDRYYAVWAPPSVPDSASLVVTLKIRVKRDGTVLAHELMKSSGNSLMDGSVIEAARQVTKIDPLPPGLGREDIIEIPINFKPE